MHHKCFSWILNVSIKDEMITFTVSLHLVAFYIPLISLLVDLGNCMFPIHNISIRGVSWDNGLNVFWYRYVSKITTTEQTVKSDYGYNSLAVCRVIPECKRQLVIAHSVLIARVWWVFYQQNEYCIYDEIDYMNYWDPLLTNIWYVESWNWGWMKKYIYSMEERLFPSFISQGIAKQDRKSLGSARNMWIRCVLHEITIWNI